MAMRHYCTYFDQGFLIQGLALWRSLKRHDPDAFLWVLALDEVAADVMNAIGGADVRVVMLAQVEADDPDLAVAKTNRTLVEYYFTLSPCWPRWLLATHGEIDRITYLDADLFFFAAPDPIFQAMDETKASVLITAHRFSPALRHYERHGRFNVGLESFRNDRIGRACLDTWRAQCLAWCHDRLEDGRYADQKYLDGWPATLGAALLVLDHPGINMAPWNWTAHRCTVDGTGAVRADGEPLVVFHFARFRLAHGKWWQSGQLGYGVMPWRLRNAIYGPYVVALEAARHAIAQRKGASHFLPRSRRNGREFWRTLPLRIAFGGDWLLLCGRFYNLRLGLGRWSGDALAVLRSIFLRRNRTTETASQPMQRSAEKFR